jgi:hypothetical protein
METVTHSNVPQVKFSDLPTGATFLVYADQINHDTYYMKDSEGRAVLHPDGRVDSLDPDQGCISVEVSSNIAAP